MQNQVNLTDFEKFASYNFCQNKFEKEHFCFLGWAQYDKFYNHDDIMLSFPYQSYTDIFPSYKTLESFSLKFGIRISWKDSVWVFL